MNKIGLIYQPCGLGDILFIQKIAYLIQNMGYEVWWPVAHEYRWLKEYIPSFNFVSWNPPVFPMEEESDPYNLKSLPLPDDFIFPYKEYYNLNNESKITEELFFMQGFSCIGTKHPYTMLDKYRSLNIDYADWRDYLLFNRDSIKEDDLFYHKLGLSDTDEYIVVNRFYSYRPQPKRYTGIRIKDKDRNLRVVEPFPSANFTLFDWCKVFERAKSIYMVSTSFTFMLESPLMFDSMKDKGLYLYSRTNTFEDYNEMFKLPWEHVKA